MINIHLFSLGGVIMTIENNKNNFQKAKEEADKVDQLIIATLKSGKSFRVEAGAGSGKTYSLNRVIEWIQNNKWAQYNRKKQNVICITYTNAAVDVISERLKDKSFIIPSTIHSFAWNAIKQYQNFLIDTVKDDASYHPKEGFIENITEVQYTLGHRYIEDNVLYLYHGDVITLFAKLLDNKKFRDVFSNKYPLILIDEYQDSFQSLTNKFIEYFITETQGPQFGFFGDSWQTIYHSNKACGLIEHDNILEIKKGSNFRSAPKIVDALNKIRPTLTQISAIDHFQGEVTVITCNDFSGERRTDRNFKGELPAIELQNRLNKLNLSIKEQIMSGSETIKTLMITHKVLASQQGYEKLLDILDDKLKDKDDPLLLFFMDNVEPVLKALQNSDMPLLFETLGVKRYPITKKSQKKQWHTLQSNLLKSRDKHAIDVLKEVIESSLLPIPKQIEELYFLYYNKPDSPYANSNVKDYLNIEYSQFLAALSFLYPETEFSTEHGVKGEEYDNVIFAIGKGWNQYQFDVYAPMITFGVQPGKEDSFVRNRNLFYVCCSRPKKRLFIFVSTYVEGEFETFLKLLSGDDNYYTYSDYME